MKLRLTIYIYMSHKGHFKSILLGVMYWFFKVEIRGYIVHCRKWTGGKLWKVEIRK